MVSYRGDLPSLHLNPDEFKDLVEVMERHLSSTDTKIQVGSGGFTRTFDDVDELMDDSSIPPYILDFKITVQGDEGKCTLNTDSFGMLSISNDVWISGDEDWVKTKKTDLDEFFSHKNNRMRTILEKMRFLFPVCLLFASLTAIPFHLILGGQWAYWIGLGSYNIYWIFGIFGLNAIYPYAMLQTKEGHTYRPYLKKLVSWIIGLITVVAGVLTIVNYLP